MAFVPLGDNLSNHLNLEWFESRSPEGLLAQLKQIRMPHKVLAFYHDGTKHIAWVSLSRKIRFKKEKVK